MNKCCHFNPLYYLAYSKQESVLAEYDARKISNSLKKVRRKSRPLCKSPEELNDLMNENDDIYRNYGQFYGRDFYRCMIMAGNHRASLFVLSQVEDLIPAEAHIFVDGTFRTKPVGFAQVLVMFAIVEGKVCLPLACSLPF